MPEPAWLTGRLGGTGSIGCKLGHRLATVSPQPARRLPSADPASEPLGTEKMGRRLAQGPRAPRAFLETHGSF